MFYTDLDRTIIFSNRFNKTEDAVVVEEKDGKPIGYMTKTAYEMARTLLKKGYLIPVTARSKEEVDRIQLFQEYTPEWMVCEGGARVYHNGENVEEWEAYLLMTEQPSAVTMAQQQAFQAFTKMGMLAGADVSRPNIHTVRVKTNNQTNKEILHEMRMTRHIFKKLFCEMYEYERQIVLMTNAISKQKGVSFIQHQIDNDFAIVAGDSEMDHEMLSFASYSMIPAHHTIEGFKADYETKEKGMKAGEEILKATGQKLLAHYAK